MKFGDDNSDLENPNPKCMDRSEEFELKDCLKNRPVHINLLKMDIMDFADFVNWKWF